MHDHTTNIIEAHRFSEIISVCRLASASAQSSVTMPMYAHLFDWLDVRLCANKHNQTIRQVKKLFLAKFGYSFCDTNKQIHVWQRLVTTRAPTDHFTPKFKFNLSSLWRAHTHHSEIINKHDSAWNWFATQRIKHPKWLNLPFLTSNNCLLIWMKCIEQLITADVRFPCGIIAWK